MANKFVSTGYIAMALLKTKYEIFNESFITMSELNQFAHFVQREFNNRNLDLVVTYNSLSREDFDIVNGVIVASENCCYDVHRLSIDVLCVLTDKNLFMRFFTELEKEKIITLEKWKTSTSKTSVKGKAYQLQK